MPYNFPNITFKDPYFRLLYSERLLFKAISVSFYSVLLILALILLTSDTTQRKSFGFLILLFLGDTILQRKFGERTLTGRIISELSQGKELDVSQFFSSSARAVLDRALKNSEVFSGIPISISLIRELSDNPEVIYGFLRLGIDKKKFIGEVTEIIENSETESTIDREKLVSDIEKIAIEGFKEAVAFGETAVSDTSIFLAALNLKSPQLSELFSKFNFSETDFRNAIIFGRLAKGLGKKIVRNRGAIGRRRIPHRIMNRAWTSRPTPTLDMYSQDLTDLARLNMVGFMIGHEQDYKSLVNILSREEKNNAILVGIEGTGRETIVNHLAFQITRDEVPPKLFDKRLVKLSMSNLSQNLSPGELQARLGKIVDEILLAGNIVLYIPDIHSLKIIRDESGISAFDILKPVFNASLIPVVGITDPQSFRQIIEPDPDFRNLFEKIDVEELSPEQTLTLLTYESWILEAREGITISYPAISKAVELAYRYLRRKPLPASAVDLLQEAIASAKSRGEKVLTPKIVSEIVTEKTKIPVERPKEKETELLLKLEEKIHERLINQEEAVKAVASAMRQYRAGLTREKGPIATFLFVGPTGVGKTELAKALADVYFGGEKELIRFDMSQFKDKHSIWNFIGSPDGSIPGAFIEAAKAKPFAVLLLDEFEKTHPDILELFLPIFDEGYVTSSLGEKIDLSNMIIIATSNAHSELIKKEVERGRPFSEIVSLLKKGLVDYFKPELINRFDGIIAFRQLTQEEIEKIALLQLKALTQKLSDDQGIIIEIDSSVPKYLAKIGWDPVYGARPLRGIIRERIREIIAQKILRGELSRGQKALMYVENDSIIIKKYE